MDVINKLTSKKVHLFQISSESSDNETNSRISEDENFKCITKGKDKKNESRSDTKLENNSVRSLRSRINKGYVRF
jgi:hypothetical protein